MNTDILTGQLRYGQSTDQLTIPNSNYDQQFSCIFQNASHLEHL